MSFASSLDGGFPQVYRRRSRRKRRSSPHSEQKAGGEGQKAPEKETQTFETGYEHYAVMDCLSLDKTA